ncbi:unnamed protein product [Clonostachys chloroleuca]|uniref:Ubiquitin-like domain-containing protein n=1 Tax=Clonostachys chloroleuca TaxID=1926264 RepID=A0AA35Q023_9HYPO|nr:unnamed protein product [Clonostachys chloroleuca]
MTSENSHLLPSNGNLATDDEEKLTVNLQIVSPSLSVGRPLHFPELAASTTIKELKERIRSSLPLRPPDDHQRLIHRGRALVRETDTLSDVLGEDAIRSLEQQTMHLVVRDAPNAHSSSTPTPTGGPSPNTSSPAPANPQRHTHGVPFGPQPPPGFPRRNPTQPTPGQFTLHSPAPTLGPNLPNLPIPQPIDPSMPFPHQQHHNQHQNLSTWIGQVQREALTRALINQNQRNRANVGMRGIGDGVHHGHDTNSGRASPALGHYYREHIGPNGQTFQVETIIRGSHGAGNGQNGALSPADVQNLLRQGDINQATATMTNAMQRSASNVSLHSRFMQPMATNSGYPHPDSRAGSGRATPEPTARSVSGGQPPVGSGSAATPSRGGYDVYVLSSPEGPRALLVNNSNSETYYSPRLPTQNSYHRLRNLVHPEVGTTESSLPPNAETQHQNAVRDQQPPIPAQNQDQPPADGNANAQANNAQVGGLPPLLVQAWPHIWLAFRLAVFVWFFTSPTASWSRWFSVIGIAVLIFILSVGALNNIAELLWRPLAQQLENMLPRLDPQVDVRGGALGQNGVAVDGGQNADHNPAQLAARLVAQQRERETWLQSQIRRIERASLLFLASIAPGVAERHIANLEAEARAERQRREAEAAAAEAAAEAAREAQAAAANAEGNNENNPDAQGNQPAQDHHGVEDLRANQGGNPGGLPELVAI